MPVVVPSGVDAVAVSELVRRCRFLLEDYPQQGLMTLGTGAG
jgi:hypothetical protein